MSALWEQSHQNHQVGKGKEPLIRPDASRFGGAGNKAEMTGLGEIMNMLDTYAR